MPSVDPTRADAPPRRASALIFEDPASRLLLRQIERVAPTDATVLITGETGTGKEIVARHVHACSTRCRRPFLAVNCGALSASLLESELFGHEKGAFTGALTARAGWFEAANGGTLFLDEVGDLPMAAQVKLLRVLQEREVVRVGARAAVKVDVRVVAATNVDLGKAVAEGHFRADLYYRLYVAHLEVAPLRDRPHDLVPLARQFLAAYGDRLGLARTALGDDAIARLRRHPWPGNVRELENAMHHALLVADDGCVTADDLRLLDARSRPVASPAPAMPQAGTDEEPRAVFEKALGALFEEQPSNLHDAIERMVYRAAYAFSGNNQLGVARLLGVSRNVVRARLMHHGLLIPPVRRVASLSSPRSVARVRVGHQPFGVLPLVKATRALEEGLARGGSRVEWTEHASGMDVIDAIAAGTLDLGVVGESPPVFAQAARAPMVYLAAEPPAPEGEAIVVHAASSVTRLEELRGKTLAVTRGANVVYFVVRALEEVGLSLADVTLRSLGPVDARAAFMDGAVDAWAVWNPHLATLRHALPVRSLRDARGLAANRAFYVARRAFADEHPAVVEAFLRQVGAVGRWANRSRAEAVRALAPAVDLPAPVIDAILDGVELDARPIDADVIASQQRIADTFHRLRLITRPVRIEEALWARPTSARRSA